MASLGLIVELSVAFTMESCVRGYHVYQNTWVPIHGEHLRCSRECGNRADAFAVAVVKGEDTVGHVPRRFSCATNLFIQSGGVVACEIYSDRRYSRDLPQGGMEIPCVYIFSGAPDLVDNTKRRLNELQAQIKECSILLDSQQAEADVLPQTDSSCKRTSEQISDDSVESVKASGHKTVNLEVVEITDYNNNSMVGSNNVWLKIQDIKTHDSESRGQEEAGRTRRMNVLFTGSTALKFVNALNKPPLKLSLSYQRLSTF